MSVRKKRMINASILAIAFVIMLAALMYNPQGTNDSSSMDDVQITVHGTVTDENGILLESAIVRTNSPYGLSSAYTDAGGSYSLTFNAKSETVVSAVHAGHWAEFTIIYPDDKNTNIFENFTLQSNMNASVPIGIVAQIDDAQAVTSYSLEVNLTDASIIIRQSSRHQPIDMVFSAGELTSKVPLNDGSMSMHIDVRMTGSYWKSNGTIRGITCEALSDAYCVPTNEISSEITASTEHKSYNMANGENQIITLASMNSTYHFPAYMSPNFSIKILGNDVTFNGLGLVTADYDRVTYRYLDASTNAVSMNMSSLVEDHSYEVYIQDGCVIYIQNVTLES